MLIKSIHHILQAVILVVFIIPGNVYSADSALCGDIIVTPARDGGGPWDYRDPINRRPSQDATNKGGRLQLVEGAHFTKEVESLIKGKSGWLIGDIDYTLFRFPNHHRALRAMSKLQIKNDGKLPARPGAPPEKRYAECYFERAIAFRPDDYIVHMLYGIHLHLSGEYKKAEKRYQYAEVHIKDSSELFNNMGLLYYEMGNYKKSLNYAKKAYSLGYPLPGLKNKLIAEGQWKDK
ncbi:MAG: tetratricopeptide repeat protein [Gammaproteobacteria bacterium]|nr:tetratricopeptide repeat protein [Gammaproteobacteria bacterium]